MCIQIHIHALSHTHIYMHFNFRIYLTHQLHPIWAPARVIMSHLVPSRSPYSIRNLLSLTYRLLDGHMFSSQARSTKNRFSSANVFTFHHIFRIQRDQHKSQPSFDQDNQKNCQTNSQSNCLVQPFPANEIPLQATNALKSQIETYIAATLLSKRHESIKHFVFFALTFKPQNGGTVITVIASVRTLDYLRKCKYWPRSYLTEAQFVSCVVLLSTLYYSKKISQPEFILTTSVIRSLSFATPSLSNMILYIIFIQAFSASLSFSFLSATSFLDNIKNHKHYLMGLRWKCWIKCTDNEIISFIMLKLIRN